MKINAGKVVYSPKGPFIQLPESRFQITRLMYREIVSAKDLIWRLFLRDFSSRYRQSVFGILWSFIMPVITVAMFIIMNHAGILAIPDVGVPYPLYALIGLSIWNLFTVGLTASANSIVSAGGMVGKINFPKAALVIAASANGPVEFMIRLILILATSFYLSMTPHWFGLLIGILLLIPLYLFMLGIGFVLSLVTAILRDVPNILNLCLTGLMLLTPILYPIRGNNVLARMNAWNPFNYLVNTPRNFMLTGHSDMLTGFILASLLSGVIFYVGWRLFYLAQTKIAERL